jgi:hypothetical protein
LLLVLIILFMLRQIASLGDEPLSDLLFIAEQIVHFDEQGYFEREASAGQERGVDILKVSVDPAGNIYLLNRSGVIAHCHRSFGGVTLGGRT